MLDGTEISGEEGENRDGFMGDALRMVWSEDQNIEEGER